MVMRDRFSPGDRVVYRKFKHSAAPGPRARFVDPAPRGEEYSYSVDKFWIVVEQKDEDHLLLATRRGKQHVVESSDPNLRRANWWERLFYRDRFPESQVSELSAESA